MSTLSRGLAFSMVVIACLSAASATANEKVSAEIQVVDASTGRGVPLVELETVNHLKFVTDNAGRVAFHEPGLMDRELFFFVRSHGYEIKKDGFGFAGVRLTPRAGKRSEIQLTRRNLAERLCRLTGQGLYRDSVLLGHKPPLKNPLSNGLVAGQDSVQAVPYRGAIYWFWGDTTRMSYPLGLFRMAGARTPPLNSDALAAGIDFDYFVDKSGFARAMMPLPERPQGVIWLDGFCTVADDRGRERLLAHYSRRKGLMGELEHGLAVFNDDTGIFESVKQLPLEEPWRCPRGHATILEEDGKRWLLFGNPVLNVRVPATLKDVVNPQRYEAFTCVAGSDVKAMEPEIANSKPAWRWRSDRPPVDSATEHRWLKAGRVKPEDAHFCPTDAAGERVILHSGTVRWNKHRQRWIMLAGQVGGKASLLGEVWYAEARAPTGPFRNAVRIVTHDRQSFYNVCHHDFLDAAGGRIIHFEGTYTNDFSGNPERTPRYNYNQVLYRLDLDDERLQAAKAR